MNVKLREKKGKHGKSSLYLAIWDANVTYEVKSGKHKGQIRKGKWRYEYLNLHLLKNGKDNKKANQAALKVAEQIRAKRQIELYNEMYGFVSPLKKKANFIKFLEDTHTKGFTLKGTLKQIKEFAGDFLSFQTINEEWMESWKEFLLSRVSQNTALCYFSITKSALNRAVKKKIIPYNPASHVANIKKEETERVYLTFEEIQKLAVTDIKQKEVKRAFLFACYTGLRASDVLNLTWDKIQDGKLKFRQQKTKGFEYFPLSPTALELLYQNGHSTEQNPKERIFKVPVLRWINEILKTWAKKAGIKKNISFHTSRHTFATLALTSGADLYVVSKLLGHTKIETTQIYAKIIDQKKEEAVNLMPKLKLGE
jgi:integrase